MLTIKKIVNGWLVEAQQTPQDAPQIYYFADAKTLSEYVWAFWSFGGATK